MLMVELICIEVQGKYLTAHKCCVQGRRVTWAPAVLLNTQVDLTYPANLQSEALTELERQFQRLALATTTCVAIALPSSYVWQMQLESQPQFTEPECLAYIEHRMQQVMQEQAMQLAWDYEVLPDQRLRVFAIAHTVVNFFQQLCERYRCRLLLLTCESQAIAHWAVQQTISDGVVAQRHERQVKLFLLAQQQVIQQHTLSLTHEQTLGDVIAQFDDRLMDESPQIYLTGTFWQIGKLTHFTRFTRPPQSFISQGLYYGAQAYA
jgi:hypothetical protein